MQPAALTDKVRCLASWHGGEEPQVCVFAARKMGLDKVSALPSPLGVCVAVTLPPPSQGWILNKRLNNIWWHGRRSNSFPRLKHCPHCYWYCYRGWDEGSIQPARDGVWGTGVNCSRREGTGTEVVGMDHEGSETVLVASGSSLSWDYITALAFAEMFGNMSPVAHEKSLYEGTAWAALQKSCLPTKPIKYNLSGSTVFFWGWSRLAHSEAFYALAVEPGGAEHSPCFSYLTQSWGH